LFIVFLNPASGPARDNAAEELLSLFKAEGADARVIHLQKGSAESIIAKAAQHRPHALVAAGGDGTVRAVASATAGSSIPLGVVPLGTLNHFAKDAGIPLDLKSSIKTIVAGHVARFDAARVNGRLFLNNSSIGIYPNMVEHRERLRRQGARKWPAFVRAIAAVLRESRELTVHIDIDRRKVVARTPFLFVGNNEYTTEGFRLGSRRRLDSGQLFVYMAPRFRTRDLPKLFFWSLAGRAGQRRAFEIFASAHLVVDTPRRRRLEVSTDGEVEQMVPPLRFALMPSALKVFVPVP